MPIDLQILKKALTEIVTQGKSDYKYRKIEQLPLAS